MRRPTWAQVLPNSDRVLESFNPMILMNSSLDQRQTWERGDDMERIPVCAKALIPLKSEHVKRQMSANLYQWRRMAIV